jgi:hypothetical protein
MRLAAGVRRPDLFGIVTVVVLGVVFIWLALQAPWWWP